MKENEKYWFSKIGSWSNPNRLGSRFIYGDYDYSDKLTDQFEITLNCRSCKSEMVDLIVDDKCYPEGCFHAVSIKCRECDASDELYSN